jgi:enediyne biosynthesis protein E3
MKIKQSGKFSLILRACMASLYRAMFGIDPEETRVARRGFQVDDAEVKQRIEQIGHYFVEGYHSALQEQQPERLRLLLDKQPLEERGFVYEGAVMALVILGFFSPLGKQPWHRFVHSVGEPYLYICYVGAGWALARLPLTPERMMLPLDPVLCWLVVDGYGFHQGYFHGAETIEHQRYPHKVSGYARSAFDQGLGRSLWFVCGADPQRIDATIKRFATTRHNDLWSGVGLAAAYAGGVKAEVLNELLLLAEVNAPALAQGVVFAAKTRQRAGNYAPHTELACEIICRSSVAEMAELADRSGIDLPKNSGLCISYQHWRQRVQAYFV